MRNKSASADLTVARIAARQHGVVSISQLAAAGIGRSSVARRVEKGSLHRVHRGVYAVGHLGLSEPGRWMAAVLTCGAGAVLSHGSAAVHWGLLLPLPGPTDVSLPSQAGRRRRAGVRVHRCAALDPEHCTRRKGIPVTTPARTIADLPGFVPSRLARRARRQAEVLGLPLAGVRSDGERSDLEGDLLGLCRHYGLPLPEVNVRIGRWTVDFLWRERRLVVETDSYLYHRGRVAFEDDRERDLGLRRMDYDVLRFTEQHVGAEAGRVAALIGEALAKP